MSTKMNRRTFLKTTAAAAVAVSMTGLLGGCGGSDALAENEVQLGLYRISIYDLDVDTGTEMSGMTGSLLGKATLRFTGDSKTFQTTSYNGMFKAQVQDEALDTVSPTGTLIASNFLWGTLWGTTTVDLKMNFRTAVARKLYQNGTPATLTITINGVSTVMYLVKRDGRYVALRELPAGV